MKSLLGMESLEPRALLAGLCDVPTTTLQAPVESVPAPAAEIGPMRGGVDSSQEAGSTPSIDVDFTPPQVANPSSPPTVSLPNDVADSQSDQTQPPSLLDPPGEADLSVPKADSGSTDSNPFNSADLKGDTGSSSATDSSSPSCATDPGPVPKSAATPAPFADSSARVGSSTTPSFVSLFVTASNAAQAKQLGPSSTAQGSSADDPSAFHYFEPIGASRHDGHSLDSEPLANVAVRQTFVAFWLMTKKDLDDLQGQHDAIDTTAATSHATSSEPNVDHRQMENGMTAVIDQTDVIHKALAAISSADDVLRQADAACALASVRTAEATTSLAEGAIAQALACSATKTDQPTSPQAVASQPSSPRWQLGMCSLFSILFSFRPPTKSSDKPTATRKSLFRAIRPTA